MIEFRKKSNPVPLCPEFPGLYNGYNTILSGINKVILQIALSDGDNFHCYKHIHQSRMERKQQSRKMCFQFYSRAVEASVI
jgi:hypothetical protein